MGKRKCHALPLRTIVLHIACFLVLFDLVVVLGMLFAYFSENNAVPMDRKPDNSTAKLVNKFVVQGPEQEPRVPEVMPVTFLLVIIVICVHFVLIFFDYVIFIAVWTANACLFIVGIVSLVARIGFNIYCIIFFVLIGKMDNPTLVALILCGIQLAYSLYAIIILALARSALLRLKRLELTTLSKPRILPGSLAHVAPSRMSAPKKSQPEIRLSAHPRSIREKQSTMTRSMSVRSVMRDPSRSDVTHHSVYRW